MSSALDTLGILTPRDYRISVLLLDISRLHNPVVATLRSIFVPSPNENRITSSNQKCSRRHF